MWKEEITNVLSSFVFLFSYQHGMYVNAGYQCRDVKISACVTFRALNLFWVEERPPIRSVAANKLNKQSRTPDEGWSSSLGVGRGANKSPL